MSMEKFFKKNKIVKENVFYPATKTLCDDDGKPLLWEIKPLTTKEDEKIRDSCTMEVPITGKPGMFRNKLDTNTYTAKFMCTCIVYPDLYNAELQDAYDVKTPEDLLKEMISDSGEYMSLMSYIQSYNGFNITMQDNLEEAKN
jgi:hypothetical protein